MLNAGGQVSLKPIGELRRFTGELNAAARGDGAGASLVASTSARIVKTKGRPVEASKQARLRESSSAYCTHPIILHGKLGDCRSDLEGRV